jgi:hypothetical protein
MTCREFAGFLDAYLSGARSARAVTHWCSVSPRAERFAEPNRLPHRHATIQDRDTTLCKHPWYAYDSDLAAYCAALRRIESLLTRSS